MPSELVTHPEEEGVSLVATVSYIQPKEDTLTSSATTPTTTVTTPPAVTSTPTTMAIPTVTTPTVAEESSQLPRGPSHVEEGEGEEQVGGAFITASELGANRLTSEGQLVISAGFQSCCVH